LAQKITTLKKSKRKIKIIREVAVLSFPNFKNFYNLTMIGFMNKFSPVKGFNPQKTYTAFKLILPFWLALVFLIPTSAQDLSPEAQQQLRSLMEEKASRTPAQQKINSQILYAYKMQGGRSLTPELTSLRTGVKKDAKGNIETEITADVSDQLLNTLTGMGCLIKSSSEKYSNIRATIPLDKVEQIAALKEITYINYYVAPVLLDHGGEESGLGKINKSTSSRKVNDSGNPLLSSSLSQSQARRKSISQTLSSMLIGSVTSEGDVTHGANIIRANYGLSGAGVKIGVLSDSYNMLGGAATDVASGDLPGVGNPNGYTVPVTVIQEVDGTGSDEGRAMLQIIHDLAPAAELYFASGFNGEVDFAQQIINLRNAGCDIIVDDIGYLLSSVWQDGVIAQAVNTVTADGALYFSSAGNSGNLNDGTSGVWEGDYKDGGTNASFPGGRLHDFGTGNLFNTITKATNLIFLTWSDQWGASTNDYDFFITNSDGSSILHASLNGGTTIPAEYAINENNFNVGERIYVLKKDGSEARALRVNTNRGTLAIGTAGQTSGHNAAANTISVAATPAIPLTFGGGPFPGQFNASNVVETFSSDGPRKMFYMPDGTPITPGNFLFGTSGGIDLQKPDITAADGVSTSMPGFSPFFGTSAAAPHAAAIAALIKGALPNYSSTQIRDLMFSTTIDIEAPGVDRDAGRGIIMADKAIESLGLALLSPITIESNSSYNNGNGILEPGEVGWFNFTLGKASTVPFTNVLAVLTCATPGVTIVNGQKNIGTMTTSYTSTNELRFVTTQDLPCGTQLDFTLTVYYAGGIFPTQQFTYNKLIGAAPATISGVLGTAAPTGSYFTSSGGLNHFGTVGAIYPNGCAILDPSNCVSGPLSLCRNEIFTLFQNHVFRLQNQNQTTECISLTITSFREADESLSVLVYNSSGYDRFQPQNNVIGTLQQSVSALPTATMSFQVPAGENYTIVVVGSSFRNGDGSGISYSFTIDQNQCADVPCIAVNDIVLSPATHIAGQNKFVGTVGLPFSQTFSTTGGSGFQTFFTNLEGLPPGLTLTQNSVSATIEGIPSAPFGTPGLGDPLTIIALDALGCAPADLNTYFIEIQPCTPVSITSAVNSNAPFCSGGTLNLSVGATGQGPFTYSWAGPGGTFSNQNTATTSVSNPVSGDYTVTVSNYCGSVTSTTSVTIYEAPQITFPNGNEYILNADPGQCYATFGTSNFGALFTMTQAIGSPTPQLVFAPLSQYQVGTHSITASASNVCGSDNANIALIVRDITPPIVISRNIDLELVNGQASVTSADLDDGSSDQCSSFSLEVNTNDLITFDASNLGLNLVPLTATDSDGNQSTAVAIVNILDDLCINGDDTKDSDGGGLPDDCDCSPFDDFNDKIIRKENTNTVMDFDGINDHLSISNDVSFNPSATSSITLEAWIKPDLTKSFNTILSKGHGAGGQTTYIFDTYNFNNVGFFLGSSSGGGEWFYADSILTPNVWVNLAVTYDHISSKVSFYYNGDFVKEHQVSFTPYSLDMNPTDIGRQGYACNCNFFRGKMDEVRIWKIARTGEEIKRDLEIELKGTEPDLLAYYNFNQGVPNADNTGLSFVPDQSISEHNATLAGFTKNGSASNWVMDNLRLSVINKDMLDLCASCPETTNTAMDFDGANDFASLISKPELSPSISNSITFEAWIKPERSVPLTILSKGAGFGASTSYIFSVYLNKIGFNFGDGGTTATWLTSQTSIPLGVWSHVAVSYDNSNNTFSFYLNGNLDGQSTAPHGFFIDESTVLIGKQGSACNCNFFDGQIDEIRMWNVARSASQIQSDMNLELFGHEVGLNAYFDFNKGLPGGNNSGLTIATDMSFNENHGELNNFNKTGNASNWVTTSLNISRPTKAGIDFDGLNDFISVANDAAIIPTAGNSVTFEAWIYPEPSNNDRGIITSSGTFPNRNHQVYLNYNTKEIVVDGMGVNPLKSDKKVPLNAWTHIATVFDGTETKLYINGELDKTRNQTLSANNLGFEITFGNQAGGTPTSWNFEGKMDDIRYWNQARTISQIQENLLLEIPSSAPGLELCFNFNKGLPEGDNTSITLETDITGNAHDGTLNNFARSGNTSNYVTSPFNFYDGDRDGLPDLCDYCIAKNILTLENVSLDGVFKAYDQIILGEGLTFPANGEVIFRTPEMRLLDGVTLAVDKPLMVISETCVE
jgi:hypothetical protein